ncbi:MAG TPA: MATE family efflux transporter [Oribacterium sp.]|nr:MATE family efflux transporter [Oribacterium sp.]
MAGTSSMKDMTTGNPTRLILGFAIPMLLGTLFQQFYSMVDTIIVGRFLGVDALAGVGSTGAINFMVNGFVIGVTAGFAIPVAQRFGAQDARGLRKYVAQIIYLTVLIAVLMTLVIGVLTKSILIGTNTPASIFDYAYSYILIIFLGTPAIFLYNITASIIRSLGDAKTPVYFLIFAALLNILLDYISIGLLGFGVEGPAYATVISQGLSGFLCLLYMVKKFPILHFEKGDMKPESEKMLTLLSMGIPMGLQYSITAIGSVILQTAVNGLGAISLAAITAGQRISNFVCCVFDSLGATMATYAGQNVGALRFDRIREGVHSATIIGAVYSVLICILLILFGGEIPKLFVNADETEVITNAHRFLVCNSLFYIPLTVVNVWRFSIQGMGFSGLAILAGVCEMVARSLVGFVFVPMFGYIAACFASPLAWLFADAFLIPCFYHCLRRLKKQYPAQP